MSVPGLRRIVAHLPKRVRTRRALRGVSGRVEPDWQLILDGCFFGVVDHENVDR
jgi:hypothetical protein